MTAAPAARAASASRAWRAVRVLDKQRYAERKTSKLLPKLDVAWLLRFAEIEPQSVAVRTLRDDLAKRRAQ